MRKKHFHLANPESDKLVEALHELQQWCEKNDKPYRQTLTEIIRRWLKRY